MRVGLLKDIKPDERRVALLPRHVRVLKELGHAVFVERNAGSGSGFDDSAYERAGARVVEKADVLEESELLLKVKTPLPSEFADYKPFHVLFTYLHFDENISRQDIQALIERAFIGIAYEWVGEGGAYPLLEPMSRLTGYLFAQKAVELCAREKGIFCAANEPFLPGGRAVIVGSGNIGLSAVKYLSDLNLSLSVVHNAPLLTVEKRILQRFGKSASDMLAGRNVRFVQMNEEDPARTKGELAGLLGEADILINAAVRRASLPKTKLEYLVDREMVARMAPGSVVCDATACDKDMVETCVSSPSLHDTYREADVVHYNCDHIPALVARTASELLTESTFPYVVRLVEQGVFQAIQSNVALRNGVSCCEGWITHRLSAEKKDMPYRPIGDFLSVAGARGRAETSPGPVLRMESAR